MKKCWPDLLSQSGWGCCRGRSPYTLEFKASHSQALKKGGQAFSQAMHFEVTREGAGQMIERRGHLNPKECGRLSWVLRTTHQSGGGSGAVPGVQQPDHLHPCPTRPLNCYHHSESSETCASQKPTGKMDSPGAALLTHKWTTFVPLCPTSLSLRSLDLQPFLSAVQSLQSTPIIYRIKCKLIY